MHASGLRGIGISATVLAVFGVLATAAQTQTQTNAAPPDLSPHFDIGWYHMGDMAAVPGLPGPVHDDPAHPYISNAIARGGQSNYPIADLSDPNLTHWAKDIMKKDNDEVLAGRSPTRHTSPARPRASPISI